MKQNASHVPALSDMVTLARLAARRSHSVDDYDRFQRFMAGLVRCYLESRGVSFPGLRLLDVGAAWGGYGQVFAEAGARVTYLDLSVDRHVPPARRRAFVAGDAARLPLAAGTYDLVFCASLVEHVPAAAALLAELYRVLRPGGRAYVGFPPFYSPVGGHQFKPFHLLGEPIAVRLAGGGAGGYAGSHEWGGLYRRTIRGMDRLLRRTGFQIEHVSTRFSALNVARLPWLGEFLTWYVQFVVFKPRRGVS